MQVVAGCDGGGTKCTVRISLLQDGVSLREGQATAGPANVDRNPAQAIQSICQATREALGATRLPQDQPIDVLVAALAGAGTEDKQDEWKQKLSEHLPIRRAEIIPDVMAIFAAAEWPNNVPSIATVVGTGSIAWGKATDGRMSRAGGLGPQHGDKGSGYWIGQQAIANCRDSGSELLQQLFGIAISQRIDDASPAHVADLARHVFAAASHNAIANEIVTQAESHIARLITEVAREIAEHTDEIRWLCAGGVAVHQPAWLERIRDRCTHAGVKLSVPVLVQEPVVGALRMATDLANLGR